MSSTLLIKPACQWFQSKPAENAKPATAISVNEECFLTLKKELPQNSVINSVAKLILSRVRN
jgi:hypothetical protein